MYWCRQENDEHPCTHIKRRKNIPQRERERERGIRRRRRRSRSRSRRSRRREKEMESESETEYIHTAYMHNSISVI
jgi:hypothetical protein